MSAKNLPKIAQVVVGLPLDRAFDYSIGKTLRKDIAVGMRVRIKFNHRVCTGFVIGTKPSSAFKRLNPILKLLDRSPAIDANALEVTQRVSEYYGCSWGEAMEIYLPANLRRPAQECQEVFTAKSVKNKKEPEKKILLYGSMTDEQWLFIAEKIAEIVAQERSVIFLVPEAAQVEKIKNQCLKAISKDGQSNLSDIVVLDKKLPPKEELAKWIDIKSGKGKIVIGTRSAVFAPTPNLGLIIIFDEANRAYKQEQMPHYHVHEVAKMRQTVEHCDLLLISKVPLVETWQCAHDEKWEIKYLGAKVTNTMQVVDMTNYSAKGASWISFPLQNVIEKFLSEKKKILIFFNRKGFSTKTQCNQCGYVVKCERCNTNLAYMYAKKALVCRHCSFSTPLPKICPSCNSSYLRSTGAGIEKLESDLARFYPTARVSRYDKDTPSFPQNADIVVATEAVFHCQEELTCHVVAMLNFDVELNRADFRSAHRAFELLVSLRSLAKEKFVVQTRMVENYCLRCALSMDFNEFYKTELEFRREAGLPPAQNMVAIGLRGAKEQAVFEQSNELYQYLNGKSSKYAVVSEPHTDVLPKIRDKYRYTIMLRGRSVEKILGLTKNALGNFRRKNGVVITVNVDP